MRGNELKVTFNQHGTLNLITLYLGTQLAMLIIPCIQPNIFFYLSRYFVSFCWTLSGLVRLLSYKKMSIFCLTISKKFPQALLTVADK